MDNIDFTNFGERMGSEPHGFGYYAHLSIYDFVRPQAVGQRVLDVGCGTGYGSKYLKQSGALEVVALERDEALVNELTRRHPDISTYRCDLDHGILPAESQSFDVVFCSNVLEHVAYVNPIVAEFHRVVKPDGCVLVAIPPIADIGGIYANAQNIFHISNLPVWSWQTKLERFFNWVQPIRHGVKDPDIINGAGAAKKREDCRLEDFLFQPCSIDALKTSITAMFLCRLPRAEPLDASHEKEIPAAWQPLRVEANGRQQVFVDLSQRLEQLDAYWRGEIADIKANLAQAEQRGENAAETLAVLKARLAYYYQEDR